VTAAARVRRASGGARLNPSGAPEPARARALARPGPGFPARPWQRRALGHLQKGPLKPRAPLARAGAPRGGSKLSISIACVNESQVSWPGQRERDRALVESQREGPVKLGGESLREGVRGGLAKGSLPRT
jgi:hypothetical protein